MENKAKTNWKEFNDLILKVANLSDEDMETFLKLAKDRNPKEDIDSLRTTLREFRDRRG